MNGPRSFLALGDSYTIGEGVPEEGRWPVLLASLAARRGVPIAPPRIIARTGWTTDELAAAIADAAPAGPFDLVSLLVGVNDQYRGRPADEYGASFRGLLETAISLAGGQSGGVVVLSIPDWGVTPFAAGRDAGAIAADIDRFNEIARTAATSRGARFVDVTHISRSHGPDPAFLAADGLHPSAAMYALWAEMALPEGLAGLAGD